MAWPLVKLSDICSFRYGKSLPATLRKPGTIRVYGSNGQVGTHDESFTNGPTVIVGRKGSVGEVHFSPSSCWPIDTTYFIDNSTTDADLGWLSYRLRGIGLTHLNKAAAVPGLNRDDAYRLTLLLPSVEEQRRIAHILDRADALRAKRRETLARLDDLTQSIFLDMFGDPVENDRHWDDSLTLDDVAAVSSGVTKGRRLNESTLTRDVPYMAVANVQDRRLDLAQVKKISVTENELNRYRLERGDLLLTEGGDPDKLGRGSLWEGRIEDCVHQNHIFRVRLKSDRVRPLFLNWLIGSARGKRYFLRSAKQTTGIASINMTQLRAFPMLTPPVEVQHEFQRRIGEVTLTRARAADHLANLDEVFLVLQERAFAGLL